MKVAYDKWWINIQPYLINENVPLAKEKPFWVQYEKQKGSTGIKDWLMPNLN